jgi:hypothetical protein
VKAPAIVVSRLVVLGAAVAGALLSHRVSGWTTVDPMHVSTSFGRVGNALLAGSVRWDAIGYLRIAAHGYTRAGDTILFPGYPLAIAALGWVVRSDVVAAVLVSVASLTAGMGLLHRLTAAELGARAAGATVVVLAFAPVSLFFTAVYTESLFLALSVGSVYAARRGRWTIACLLAAAASVTRVTGVLLVIPLALMRRRERGGLDPGLLGLLLAPAALLAFFAYMEARGYGWLAPLRNQHAHRFAGPQATVADAVRDAAHGVSTTLSGAPPVAPSLSGALNPPFDSIVLVIVLILAILALVVAFRRLPLEYGLYAAAVLLVTIASETKVQPLEGLDRYCLTIFPLWMGAGAWLAERRAVRPVVVVGAALLGFYTFEFARWAFVA